MAGTSSSMTMTVQIPLDENEPLGCRPNDAMVVTDVQEGSPAAGHLLIGDQIQSVNERQIKNVRAFYQVLRAAHPVARIAIKRPRNREETPSEVRQDIGDNLPPQIATVLTRRPGYHYKLAEVARMKGTRFGLAIKTRDNRVIVTEVLPNSMCSSHLQLYDHIIYVDGTRVTQAEVAQALLTKGLKQNGKVEVVIGRPDSEEAKQAAKTILSREDAHDPPSVRLNVDVQQIMRKHIVERAANLQVSPQSIVNHAPADPNKRVNFANAVVYTIQSDNVGRALRPVTLGVPNSPVRQPAPQQ